MGETASSRHTGSFIQDDRAGLCCPEEVFSPRAKIYDAHRHQSQIDKVSLYVVVTQHINFNGIVLRWKLLSDVAVLKLWPLRFIFLKS